MKKNTFRIGLAALLMSTTMFFACSDSSTKDSKDVAEKMNDDKFDTKASEKDAQFVVDATASSLNEVGLADVALNKSTNSQIKKLAQMLKDDHNALINELSGLAAKKSITVPTAATEDGVEAAKKLTDTDAKNFDKDWLEKVKDSHEKSIDKYQDGSNNAGDADIKGWFTNTLPKIKSHLDMTKQQLDMMK